MASCRGDVMNRKRFIKKMMGLGFSRNFARKSAELLQQMNLEAQAANRRQMHNYSWLLARGEMMRNLDEWSEYTAIKRRRKADEAENGGVDFTNQAANSNMGVSIKPDEVLASAPEALNNPRQRKYSDFLQKSLNIFVTNSSI